MPALPSGVSLATYLTKWEFHLYAKIFYPQSSAVFGEEAAQIKDTSRRGTHAYFSYPRGLDVEFRFTTFHNIGDIRGSCDERSFPRAVSK
jgi:hypothetical protein